MVKLLLLIFIVSSVFCFVGTNAIKDVCKDLKKPKNFKARSWYHLNDKIYEIEEYQFGGKGKVIVTLNEESSEYYFEQSDDKTVSILEYNRVQNQCKKRVMRKKNIRTLNKKKVVENYDFYDFENGVFGPTALWTKLLARKSEMKQSEDKEKVREIESQLCTISMNKFEDFGQTFATLYFANDSWRIFDKIKEGEHLPIRLRMNSAERPSGKDKSFAIKIDYLTFEDIEEDSESRLHEFEKDEKFWITPKVCEPLNSKRPEVKIPYRLKMVIDRFDGLNKNKESDYLERKKVILDQNDGFISFNDYKRDDLTRIYEPVNRLYFKKIKGDSCTSSFNQEMSEKEEVNDLIRELVELNGSDYFLVGNKKIRNTLTDVYKRIYVKNRRRNNREIFTFYLQKNEDDEKFTHKPLRLEAEEYDEKDNKLIRSISYNLYDFEDIDNYSIFEELDLSECVPDELTQEFSIVAEKSEGDNLETEKKVIENEVRKLLMKASEQIVLYFPEIDIKIYQEEIIAKIKMIDIVNPLVHFRATEIKIDENKSTNLKKAKSVIECASKTLQIKRSKGFQYCQGEKYIENYCDIITSQKKGILVVKQNDPQNCVTKETILTDRSIIKYSSLEQKIEKLITAKNKGELFIKVGNKKFTFSKLERIKDEIEIDRSKLFEVGLDMGGKKFKESETKKKLEYEDGIVNLASCYEACTDPKNDFDCDSFTFCHKFDEMLFDCQLGSIYSEEDRSKDKNIDDLFEDDKECNTYIVSSLHHFVEHVNKKLKEENKEKEIEGAIILQTYEETDGNECALYCLNRNRDNSDTAKHCSTIEVCNEDKSEKPVCRLSSTQTLWDDEKTMDRNENCNVYSVRHILNFHSTTKEKLYRFVEEVKDTLDACATVCDAEMGCEKFNYCQQEQGNLCRYLSDQDDKQKKDTVLDSEEIGCVTYVHRNVLIGALSPSKETKENKINDGTGFKGASLAGFIFLALFIGLVLGAAGFYGQKVYYGKNSDQDELIGFSTIREESGEL